MELSGMGFIHDGDFPMEAEVLRGLFPGACETFVGGTDGASRTWVVGTIGLTGFLENAVGSMGFKAFVRQTVGSVSRASLGIRRGFVVFGGGKGGVPTCFLRAFGRGRPGFPSTPVGSRRRVPETFFRDVFHLFCGYVDGRNRSRRVDDSFGGGGTFPEERPVGKGRGREVRIPTPESASKRMPTAVPSRAESPCSLGAQQSVF